VNLREDLTKRSCFIILRQEAGAGLQGVYDVADRVEESAALKTVAGALRARLQDRDPAAQAYALAAMRAAKWASMANPPLVTSAPPNSSSVARGVAVSGREQTGLG